MLGGDGGKRRGGSGGRVWVPTNTWNRGRSRSEGGGSGGGAKKKKKKKKKKKNLLCGLLEGDSSLRETDVEEERGSPAVEE